MHNFKKFVMIKENVDSAASKLENELSNDTNVYSVMAMDTYIVVTIKDLNKTTLPSEFDGIPVKIMQKGVEGMAPSIQVNNNLGKF